MHGIAAQHFGLSKLHRWQLNVLEATTEGKDCLVVQPTGSGKSICFCIPPIYTAKTAIVISPTISLMTDQVRKLQSKGISATLLGSAQKEDIRQNLEDGQFRVVYSTPESFIDKVTSQPRMVFQKMAREGKLCLVAIDEAHLISTWKSFRWVWGLPCIIILAHI